MRARWRKKCVKANSVAGQCRTERAGESYQAFKPVAGQDVPGLRVTVAQRASKNR